MVCFPQLHWKIHRVAITSILLIFFLAYNQEFDEKMDEEVENKWTNKWIKENGMRGDALDPQP